MQKIRKNQWTVSEIFKDGPRTTDGPQTRVITKDPLGRTRGPKITITYKFVSKMAIGKGIHCLEILFPKEYLNEKLNS